MILSTIQARNSRPLKKIASNKNKPINKKPVFLLAEIQGTATRSKLDSHGGKKERMSDTKEECKLDSIREWIVVAVSEI